MKAPGYDLALLVTLVLVLLWSGIDPHDRFTWFLEVAPVLIGVPVLVYAYPRFRFTRLTYTLIWFHAVILMVGGHYTYAQVPFGFWMQDAFGFARNHYDRIGHFAQGFVPAMLAREILLRKSPLPGSRWLPFVVLCFCLAFSAFYELIEFWTALASGEAATDFLGTQGDVWDTQWDMQLALIGAITALLALSREQDRQLKSVKGSPMAAARLPLLLLLLLPLVGCGDSSRAESGGRGVATAETAPAAPPPWSPRPITARPDPLPPGDTLPRPAGVRPLVLTPEDSALWPVKGPVPRPGSLLPGHRIVAYYGNTLSTRMGILGRIPRDSMLGRLEETAIAWAKADTTRPVMPALHFIATVAQGKPGPGRKYRLRMGDSVIAEVASWTEQRGWIMFLDVQIGHSTVEAELAPLLPFLARPYVHLALDPEFAMTQGGIPGQRVGTLDARHVNYASGVLAKLVDSLKLPPKVLIVHRFKGRMLTNHDRITLDPRVQVLIQMDGFGTPRHKQYAYRLYIVPEPVQFTGFKLFYKNDRTPRAREPGFEPSCPERVFQTVGCGDDGLMTPEQVLSGLYPVPLYVQYQ